MKLLSFFAATLILIGSVELRAEQLFNDGFESGSLGSAWSISRIYDGRVQVSTAYGPATGAAHLVLDDSVSDALFSAAEATLTLDLSSKKTVILSFKAKSLGNEPHNPPTDNFTSTRSYDGVAISPDGGVTWRSVQSLANVGTQWESFSIELDSQVKAMGLMFGPGFRIRFSGYDNAPIPMDGLAIDDVSITGVDDQRSLLELPASVMEGSGPHTGYALVAIAPTTPLTLLLVGSPSGQLALPSTVVIPAGETFASFQFSAAEDSLVNLTRSIEVSASATGVTATPTIIKIDDNDIPIVTLSLPEMLPEGVSYTNNAMLTIDQPTTVPINFALSADPWGELTFPISVTIPAGQTQVAFSVRAVNDSKIDGDVSVTMTALANGFSASNQTTTVDNETRTLGLTLATSVLEGNMVTGTVSISGNLPTALEVSLSCSSEAAQVLPASVTIPAGMTQASFNVTAVDNNLRDGTRAVTVDAVATNFTGISKPISVRDNEVAAYRFGTLAPMVNISNPVSVTISATDVEGNTIIGYTGTVNLSVVFPDGSTQSITPATTTLSGPSGWSGNVTLPNVVASPLVLQATDTNGNSGKSASFVILRTLGQAAADLLWDTTRNRIYASIPATATGSYANKIIAIDPVSLTVTGSVTTNQDPGQMAITSDYNTLYAVLNANGTIAKINLDTMTVSSTFAVGTDSRYGTLYASDICTVAGQPNLVVVSQYRKSVSPSHNGVAVYDNGVMRPIKTQDHTGSNIIEASADPTIFFGYNTGSTEYGFRRLKLDENGMTQIEVNTGLLSGFSTNMRSDGDKVYSTTGVALNGAQMKRLGSFGVSGLVVPDSPSNRVYYLESPNSGSYNRISAYDPTTFSLVHGLNLPSAVSSAASFIRWGSNGLAFRNSSTIFLVNSGQLVPNDPDANLVVTVKGVPNPAKVGSALTYTVQVTNQGPNPAKGTVLNATFSDSQTILSTAASTGTPVTSGLFVTLPVGELVAGATATLTVVAMPQSAGSITCSASGSSTAIDPDFTNNTASKLISVGFEADANSVNQLRLTANSIVYDPTRNLLWLSIPSSVAAPLGKSVLSLDPLTGLMSDPIPVNAAPTSLAISANGQYLYVGLNDVPEVQRINLATRTPDLRIPLGSDSFLGSYYAEDMEVLSGDGTSLLVSLRNIGYSPRHEGVAVYDGAVKRPNQTSGHTGSNRIEATASANIFVGYNNETTDFGLRKMQIDAQGVTTTQTVKNLISGFGTEISGAGNTLLSSNGKLVNSSSLTLISALPVSGRPCVDAPYKRAYMVIGNALRSYDAVTGTAGSYLVLPTTMTGDWALKCVRWGVDGFAILGSDKIFIARWSEAVPLGADINGNSIADSWEASHFGALGVNASDDHDWDNITNGLEYLLVTSPTESSSDPIKFNATSLDDKMVMRMTFPRRAGVTQPAYTYEYSTDLSIWTAVSNVTETVLSTETIEGVEVEMVNATIPCENPLGGFIRLRWLAP
ncbi:MAG: hypothetical protein SFV81_13820 [Pirellulaceae bacterium]|nr:hypothetical protein [Pirellulaceae bacterium]